MERGWRFVGRVMNRALGTGIEGGVASREEWGFDVGMQMWDCFVARGGGGGVEGDEEGDALYR